MNARQYQGALPAAWTVESFAEQSGLGRTRIFEAIANGELRARKAGRRTVILNPDGVAYLESLPAAVLGARKGLPRGERP